MFWVNNKLMPQTSIKLVFEVYRKTGSHVKWEPQVVLTRSKLYSQAPPQAPTRLQTQILNSVRERTWGNLSLHRRPTAPGTAPSLKKRATHLTNMLTKSTGLSFPLVVYADNIKMDLTSKHNIHVKWFRNTCLKLWLISEFLHQLERPSIPHRPRELDRYMHGLSADRITFVDVYAKQLRMTLIILKTMKNAKVEQTAPANLCNPTIFLKPLKTSMERTFLLPLHGFKCVG